jgi:membrane-associated protease RseP (regulator of RpoE activity)
MYMSIIYLALLAIALFWIIVIYLNRTFDLKKHGVAFESGMLIWRTKRGLRFIDRVGKRFREFWLWFGDTAVGIGFILMIFVFVSLLLYVIILLHNPGNAVPGAKLIIPGITIPLVEGLIALFSVLLVHESSHGYVMRAQDLRTKSTGLLLWIVIPGAFVEQDDKQLQRAPLMKRLRVYAAGSFANVVFALVVFGIILALISPKPGVYMYALENGSPLDNSIKFNGLNDRLFLGAQLKLIIDNENVPHPINNVDDWNSFFDRGIPPGENLTIEIGNENFQITTVENYHDNIGFQLIRALDRIEYANPLNLTLAAAGDLVNAPVIHQYVYNSVIPWEGIVILKWIFMLNFGIGLVNLLPAVPLDGGYILRGLLERKMKKKTAKRVSYAIAIFTLALIIINFLPVVLTR